MAIGLSEATSVFTDSVVGSFRDPVAPTQFLQGFFNVTFKMSKYVTIKIKRSGRAVAVDVQRYSGGELVSNTTIDHKKFFPPFFHNLIALSDHELYDNVVGMIAAIESGVMPAGQANLLRANLKAITDDMNIDYMEIKNMQMRAIELMCAQCLRSGIVTLASDENIDYKRKAGSIVDLGGGSYWTDAVDPFQTLEDQFTWIKENGNSGATEFDCIFGTSALNALKNNTIFKERNDLRNFDSGKLVAPTRPRDGAVYHGQMFCGEGIANIWTYNQFYDHPDTGASTPYMDSTEVVIIPTDAVLELVFCLVPNIAAEGAPIQTEAFFLQSDIKPIEGVHQLHVKNASLPIPVSIDRLSTVKVVA
jgi:hypothetical protein